MICFQARLGLEGDILTDILHPLPGSGRRSRSAELQARTGTDLYLLPGTPTLAQADCEAETEDPLLECDLAVKEEEREEIFIKSEPAD